MFFRVVSLPLSVFCENPALMPNASLSAFIIACNQLHFNLYFFVNYYMATKESNHIARQKFVVRPVYLDAFFYAINRLVCSDDASIVVNEENKIQGE